MDPTHKKFYEKKSKEFRKYKFDSFSEIVKGEKPNFPAILKKYSNKNFKVLDLGCGSGELTIEMAPYFKEIIGIDFCKEYIDSANKIKVPNVKFIIADASKLPFKDESFDMIYSSRGPLSSQEKILIESLRVLKKKGLLIEETIGEKDKLELKKIFGRGQNYPIKKAKLKSIKEMLSKNGVNLLISKYYSYKKMYPTIEDVIELLNHAPIIPEFNEKKDKDKISKLKSKKEIILGFHRLIWVGKK